MREKIAELEHKQWAHIYRYIRNHATTENIARWNTQSETDYKDLTEKEKDSDREWADKVLSLPSGYIAGENEITVQEKLEMCDKMFLLIREMSQINADQVSGKRGLLKNVEVWSWLARAEDMLIFNGHRITKPIIPPSEGKK